jgi:hypothetical protein
MRKDTNKTAMQELIDDIQQAFKGQWGVYLNSEKFAPYLEKEKEQIKKANLDGYKEGCTYHSFDHRPITSEQYYNQTYNK